MANYTGITLNGMNEKPHFIGNEMNDKVKVVFILYKMYMIQS